MDGPATLLFIYSRCDQVLPYTSSVAVTWYSINFGRNTIRVGYSKSSNCHVNFNCAAIFLDAWYDTYSMYVNCLFSIRRHLKLRYYGVRLSKSIYDHAANL